jgi:hypothetical protein
MKDDVMNKVEGTIIESYWDFPNAIGGYVLEK